MGVDQRMRFSRIAIRAAGLSACLLIPLASTHAGIIDDNTPDANYQALAAQPQYDSVGVVRRLGTVIDSSGILISPNWVLTAAHTIPSGNPQPSDTWTFGGEVRGIAQAIRNPNFTGAIQDGYDIALHKLDSPITTITPAQLYTDTAASLVGDTLTYVGYGRSGTGTTGDTIPAGTKRAGNNIGDQLGFTLNPGAGQTVYSNQIIFADMDDPPGGGVFSNPLGANNPINLEYLIALGDSGGGLFVEQGGQHFVAGVHSTVFNFSPAELGYGDVMGSTTIEQSLTWILDTIAPDPIIGDLDGDGFVGIDDLNIVLGNWNQNVSSGDLGSGDPSGDGFVGIDDLNTVLGNWNAGTPPTLGQTFSAVPEPGTIALILTAGSGIVLRRRR
jgi:Trypsin